MDGLNSCLETNLYPKTHLRSDIFFVPEILKFIVRTSNLIDTCGSNFDDSPLLNLSKFLILILEGRFRVKVGPAVY